MNYKTKIKYAKEVADQLQKQKNIDAIKLDLEKEDGLYKNDIANIIASAKKILEEKYQPKINEYLIDGKQIHGSEAFSLLDKETIDILIDKESQNIALRERKKITKLIKEGQSVEEIFEQTDARFLSSEKAAEHIGRLQEIKKQNSGSGRMINIFGGIGFIALTGVLLVTMDRLFYVLPLIGLVMIVKGFTTKKME